MTEPVEPVDPDADDVLDLLVLGGGVMGLFTAYHASRGGHRVAVLERGAVGDPATASYGRTRSYRRDYLDPAYVRLADEAIELWRRFERDTGVPVLVRCGCMNVASSEITPDLADTYAQRSTDVLTGLGLAPTSLRPDEIASRYPYLRADLAQLDETGGLVDLAAVTGALVQALTDAKVPVHERIRTSAMTHDGHQHTVHTDVGDFVARQLVVTAGHGTNELLALLDGCELRIPLTRDRPSEAKYLTPPADRRQLFTSDVMPVLAYLDTGVYVHPIVEGVTDAVKIGYYHPPDLPGARGGVRDIADFVQRCLPGLADADVHDVRDVDQCDYDLVADDDFVIGAVPGVSGVHVGVGWRGTGYKFAPWVGRTLHQLALQGGTVYDITRFDPTRFVDGTGGAP